MLNVPTSGTELKPSEQERQDAVDMKLRNTLAEIRLGEKRQKEIEISIESALKAHAYHTEELSKASSALAEANKSFAAKQVLLRHADDALESAKASTSALEIEAKTKTADLDKREKTLKAAENELASNLELHEKAVKSHLEDKRAVTNAKNALVEGIKHVTWN